MRYLDQNRAPQASSAAPIVLLFAGLAACLLPFPSIEAQDTSTGTLTIRELLPTTADPGLKTDFDSPNLFYIPGGKPRPELVVFLPGTHAKPSDFGLLQKSIASGGYRLLGLMYNDIPTDGSICGTQPNPACPGEFRQERVHGDLPSAPVQNSADESIVHRLVSALQYEAKSNPSEGWDAFLTGDQPNWSKIVIAGHSQGAGMAAFIAKQYPVARVVLFSGGPDAVGRNSGVPRIASWVVDTPSRTPPDRWWAEYHPKETSGALLPQGYAALKIPLDHVLQFSFDPASTVKAQGGLAFHMTVIADPRYLPQWRQMFGIAAP